MLLCASVLAWYCCLLVLFFLLVSSFARVLFPWHQSSHHIFSCLLLPPLLVCSFPRISHRMVLLFACCCYLLPLHRVALHQSQFCHYCGQVVKDVVFTVINRSAILFRNSCHNSQIAKYRIPSLWVREHAFTNLLLDIGPVLAMTLNHIALE
jgi:hypothetical protein